MIARMLVEDMQATRRQREIQADGTQLFRSHGVWIVRWLVDAGIDAYAPARDRIACEYPFIDIRYVNHAWRGHHHPGLRCTIRTIDDIDELIGCLRANPDEQALAQAKQLGDLRDELATRYADITDCIDSAIRIIAGCPLQEDVIQSDGSR